MVYCLIECCPVVGDGADTRQRCRQKLFMRRLAKYAPSSSGQGMHVKYGMGGTAQASWFLSVVAMYLCYLLAKARSASRLFAGPPLPTLLYAVIFPRPYVERGVCGWR